MMRRSLSLALCVFLAGLVGLAGDGQPKKMDIAAHVQKLKTELHLTSEQATKVEALLKETHSKLDPITSKVIATNEEIKKLKNADSPDKGEIALKEAALNELNAKKLNPLKERDAQMKAILTDEQFSRYQTLKQDHSKSQQKRTESTPHQH